jgi:hypothetical protein
VRGKEVDELLDRASLAPHELNPALLERIAGSVKTSMRPVRPLPPRWVLSGGLILTCATVALAGAARAGFYGVEKLSVLQRALIFPTLGILVLAAAAVFASEMIPGSRRVVAPWALLTIGCLALLGVFAVLFSDYRTNHFVSAGVACLIAGLLHAVPTGLVSWWLLKRGFAMNSVAAGLVAGTLAGLAGVTMLELHCANFEALHVLLWHTAVVPLSGALGALVAWTLHFRESSGTHGNH